MYADGVYKTEQSGYSKNVCASLCTIFHSIPPHNMVFSDSTQKQVTSTLRVRSSTFPSNSGDTTPSNLIFPPGISLILC